MKIDNFFAELKRRNVYKVAVAYAVVGWLLVQVLDTGLADVSKCRNGSCGFSWCSVALDFRSRSSSPGRSS